MGKVAAGFVIYRNIGGVIQYLLLKASYPPFHWTPPKGHVDDGESELQTAYRETKEEAGIGAEDLETSDFKDEIKYEVEGKMKRVVYWLAKLKTDKEITLSHEHTDFVWAECDKAVELIGYPTTGQVVKNCHTFITKT